MNSIDAKGYNFLQQNLPGNDGYGQIGPKGDDGRNGNSVYFTPYIMDSDEIDIVKRHIIEGIELSDNPRYTAKQVEYKVNDLIVDKLGNVYILKTKKSDEATDEEFMFDIVFLNNVFSRGSLTGNTLQCVLNYNFTDEESEYYYKKKYNDSFIGPYNTNSGSPYIYHRDRYFSRICGCWLSFAVPMPDTEYRDYIYKYVFLLPNGQRIEKVTGTSSCEMFIDNRYFYGCKLPEPVTEALRDILAYRSISDNNEHEPEFTYTLFESIAGECKAYVEITNKDTHNVYRIYANGITISGDIGFDPAPEEDTPEEPNIEDSSND